MRRRIGAHGGTRWMRTLVFGKHCLRGDAVLPHLRRRAGPGLDPRGARRARARGRPRHLLRARRGGRAPSRSSCSARWPRATPSRCTATRTCAIPRTRPSGSPTTSSARWTCCAVSAPGPRCGARRGATSPTGPRRSRRPHGLRARRLDRRHARLARRRRRGDAGRRRAAAGRGRDRARPRRPRPRRAARRLRGDRGPDRRRWSPPPATRGLEPGPAQRPDARRQPRAGARMTALARSRDVSAATLAAIAQAAPALDASPTFPEAGLPGARGRRRARADGRRAAPRPRARVGRRARRRRARTARSGGSSRATSTASSGSPSPRPSRCARPSWPRSARAGCGSASGAPTRRPTRASPRG